MKRSVLWLITASLAGACLQLGCSMDEFAHPSEADLDTDPLTGKRLLGLPPNMGKADAFYGAYGPLVAGLSSATRVWTVTTRWYKKDPASGMAWSASSGLTWDEKYSAWVDSLKKTDAYSGWSNKTFILTTPWGKSVQAPALECAETAMFLRATFASWYGLPFFMEAYSSAHGRVYYGHFGIVTRNGGRVPGNPSFKSVYTDNTASMAGKTDQEIVAAWPEDSALRSRYLTALKDDKNLFLGQDAYAGAYFDEIFLNKRVGYLLLRLLTSFGSAHVAHSKNTFNLEPDALREGDVLVERWQKKGIGHVMVVKKVTDLGQGNMDAEIVYGSMPRIQPKWYNANLSKSYFVSNYTGGVGTNSDGDEYARLGGGLKRWRTPVVSGGLWYNIVPTRDRSDFIRSTRYAALSKRPATFETILGQLDADDQRKVYLQEIANARQNLQKKPASCSNRQRREEAFAKLYKLNEESFNLTREETDKAYRKLEDYVLPELTYNKSKTCCWNSSTEEMFKLIMKFNTARVTGAAAGACAAPVVFKAVDGDYEVFERFAEREGKSALWRSWSADESCPQAANSSLTDTEATPIWTSFCTVAADIVDPATGGSGGSSGSGTGSLLDGDPCGDVTWAGVCDGTTRAVWCDDDRLTSMTCTTGTTCSYYTTGEFYGCF